MTTLLEVQNLRVRLQTAHGPAEAVRGISFSLNKGETLGLVGESGCGKSLTAMALMGLLPERASTSGSIVFQGQELTQLPERAMQAVRGHKIGMVFQEPMTALNPLHRVGDQVAEPMRLHLKLSRSEARANALALLDRVGIPDAVRRMEAYPHQFSGGQRQRITIAMALACNPDLLVADEPTTALDVTVAGQILALIRELVQERGMGMILISHDLRVIANNVQRMLVMYGGSVVESGPTPAVFAQRAHPYTQGLFASRPRMQPSGARERLPSIAGTVPEMHQLPKGCAFAGRCSQALPHCADTVPPVVDLGETHSAACVLL